MNPNAPQPDTPTRKDNGDSGPSVADAVQQMASILGDARSPLIVGIENLSTESQRLAMKLARKTRATIDSSGDNAGRGNMFALQKRGRVSATLGEIKSRSDLVVFWFCDPLLDNPEFRTEFVAEQARMVAVNHETNATTQECHLHISVDHALAVEAIWTIRAQLAGLNPGKAASSQAANFDQVTFDSLQQLAESMKSANYGAIFWGSPHSDPEFDIHADGMHALIRELNGHTRFVGLPYRNDANALSAENVSAWSTGYPFAVNWNRNQPRQHWLEYSDAQVSDRNDWDCLLFFENDELVFASKPVLQHDAMEIRLPLKQLGKDEEGDYCRFDDINLTLRAPSSSDAPGAGDIMSLILDLLD